jgi:hypothetical protein
MFPLSQNFSLNVQQSSFNRDSATKPPEQRYKSGDKLKLKIRFWVVIGMYRPL